MAALPHDRPNLGRKIMESEPAGKRHRQVMQGTEGRPGVSQPPCNAAADALSVIGQRHAGNSRV